MGGKEGEQKVQESELSKDQTKILKAREGLYQSYMLPELKEYYQETKNFNLNDKYMNLDGFVDESTANNKMAFAGGKSQLSQLLKQRGIDPSNAVNQMSVQEGRSTGRVHNQALLQSIMQHNNIVQKENSNTLSEAQVKQGGISALIAQAGGTTQAAPTYFYQKAEQKGAVAQIGQGLMGAMGSMGSMPGMGGGGGGGGGGDSGMSAFTSSNTSGQGFM